MEMAEVIKPARWFDKVPAKLSHLTRWPPCYLCSSSPPVAYLRDFLISAQFGNTGLMGNFL